jgi:nicotinate phosphoribosyltransferase
VRAHYRPPILSDGPLTVFSTIALTEKESEWLKQQCPYFTEAYLAYLASYRFKPEQVKVKYIPVTSDDLLGRLEIDITGPWVETILWEVPLMACLSETYFQTVVVDWNYDQQDGVSLFIPAAVFPLNRVYGR